MLDPLKVWDAIDVILLLINIICNESANILMLFKLDSDLVDKILYKVDSPEKFKYLKKNIVYIDGWIVFMEIYSK